MSFTYVASPYTAQRGPEHARLSDKQWERVAMDIMHQRFEAVSRVTAELVKEGEVAYSPIAHSHPLAVTYDIRGDFDFWCRQNYGLLSKASKLLVVCLDGWKESKGVQAEIAFAEQCGIVVEYTDGGTEDERS